MLIYFKVSYWPTYSFKLTPPHYKRVCKKKSRFSPDLNLPSLCYFQSVLLTYFQELLRHASELWCAQTGPEWQIKLVSVSGWVAGNNRDVCAPSLIQERGSGVSRCPCFLFHSPRSTLSVSICCLVPISLSSLFRSPLSGSEVTSHSCRLGRNQEGRNFSAALLLGLPKVLEKKKKKLSLHLHSHQPRACN